jgi:hypothetical protein
MSEPTTENVIQQIEGRQSLLEAANVARDAADSILNKVAPTTGNIAKALRVCFEKTCACSECPFEYESCGDLEQLAADRLEQLERENAELKSRAEQAEAREKAAIADMKLIADNVRETHCDETCCFACKFDCDTSITDSGCYANECPGFERDDCFEWRGPQGAGKGE